MSYRVEFAEFLQQHVTLAGKTILEIGSDDRLETIRLLKGSGAKRLIASNMGRYFEAVSPVEGIELLTIDARELRTNLSPHSVDVIIGVALLEHINGIERFLDNAWDTLRPGGALVLHGNPIWTSMLGHHIWLNVDGAEYHFNGSNNPVPPWGHLYLSPNELATYLLNRVNMPRPHVYEALFQVFMDTNINRMGMSDLTHVLTSSRFKTYLIERKRARPVPAEIAKRIESRGLNEDEVAASELRVILSKP